MTTKTFQAETILEALQMVQKEMGPDAVVISARDIPLGPAWQVWKKPGIEIISMSADEIQRVPGLFKKNQQAGRIIRPNRNGSGVEFIEEDPKIEWESEAPKASIPQPERYASDLIQQIEKPAAEKKHLWKPRYLSKEDVQVMNQILSVHSEELTQEKPVTPGVNPIGVKEQVPDFSILKTLKKLIQKVRLQGVDPEFVERLETLAVKGCSPSLLEDEKKVKEFLVNYMSSNLPVKNWPALEVPGRILIFVGLSGSGKTTSLAKIAVYYSSIMSKKVVWICADTVKTGAIAEAKTFTTNASIPLEIVYTPADFRAAIQSHEDADLILVDTPSFNPASDEQQSELGSFLVEIPEAQIMLVTSATAKESDTLYCFNALKYFSLAGSILTKLDETVTYGSVFNFSRKSHLPLTFFTSDRKACAGLKIADANLLAEAFFSRRW